MQGCQISRLCVHPAHIRVAGANLPGHRSQLQPGCPATPAGADDYHFGRAAKLAQHVGGRPAGQQRPDRAGQT